MNVTVSQTSRTTPASQQSTLVRSPANPYIDELIRQVSDDATQAFQRAQLPQIRSGAQMAGQYGSSRHGIVEGIASGDLAKQLASTAAELRYRDWEQQRQGDLEQQMNEMMGRMSMYNPAGNYGNMGGWTDMALQREGMAQNRYLAEQSNALQAMQMMGGFLGQGQQNQMGAYGQLMGQLLGHNMGASQLGQQGMLGMMGMLPSFMGIPQQGYGNLFNMGSGITGFNQQNANAAMQAAMFNSGLGGQTYQLLLSGLLGLNPGQFGSTSRDYNMTGMNVGMAPPAYNGPSPNAAGIGSAATMFGLLGNMFGGGGGSQVSGLPSYLQGSGTGYNPTAGLGGWFGG